MAKLRAIVRQPVAVVVLLALFAVTAHATSITLFSSRDEFQAMFPNPQILVNFNNLPEGVPDVPGRITAGGVTIIGDLRISGGAINFTSALATPLSFAVNFGGAAASYFGADITALSRPGFYNFSVGGAVGSFTATSPGFIGFSSDVPFEAINFTFVPFADGAAGFNFVIDNVIANTVGVPEPSTLLLLGAGAVLGLVRLYTRRRPRPDGHSVAKGEESDPS